jgi:hypothetical protein
MIHSLIGGTMVHPLVGGTRIVEGVDVSGGCRVRVSNCLTLHLHLLKLLLCELLLGLLHALLLIY